MATIQLLLNKYNIFKHCSLSTEHCLKHKNKQHLQHGIKSTLQFLKSMLYFVFQHLRRDQRERLLPICTLILLEKLSTVQIKLLICQKYIFRTSFF